MCFARPVAEDDKSCPTAENNIPADIVSFIDRIEERRGNGKQILVEPADLLTKEVQVSADCSLSLVDKLEYVEFKVFHRKKVRTKTSEHARRCGYSSQISCGYGTA